MSRPPPTDIYFLILPKVHLLDLAGPAQVFWQPDWLPGLRLHYLSPAPRQVAAQGLVLTELNPLPKKLPANSWLVIVGSTDTQAVFDSRQGQLACRWLRTINCDEILLACVCSGALLAARAGLLDGKSCTTHHRLIDALRSQAPRAKVIENCIYTGAENVWTSAGISTGIDLCLFLVAQYWGHTVAAAIARDLVLYLRRAGDTPQFSIWLKYRNHVHDRIHRIQDLLNADPARHWRLPDLAKSAFMSERHLARLFRQHTGTNIGDYLQQLRLALARQLLEDENLGVEQIAAMTGFGSARQFRRIWQKWEAYPPSRYHSF